MNAVNIENRIGHEADNALRAKTPTSVETRGASFEDCLREVEGTRLEQYTEHLRKKYGGLRIESVPNDKDAIDKVSKTMHGNDVIIAPNILEGMANDARKAAYYEGKIDYFYNTVVPRETAYCATRGLEFDFEGVIVHEDGTVTYICGCSDSPERVAKVNAINKARQEKRAAQMRMQEELAIRRAMEEMARISHSERVSAVTDVSLDISLLAASVGVMGDTDII